MRAAAAGGSGVRGRRARERHGVSSRAVYFAATMASTPVHASAQVSKESPATASRKSVRKSADEAAIDEARSFFEALLKFDVKDAEDAHEFVQKLGDGEFLRRVAEHVAQKLGAPIKPRLMHMGAGMGHDNMAVYVCAHARAPAKTATALDEGNQRLDGPRETRRHALRARLLG